MYTITLTVCEQQEVEDILHSLSEAEENGLINFPFQTRVHEMTPEEINEWKHITSLRLEVGGANPLNQLPLFDNEGRDEPKHNSYIDADQFENESRN